MIRRGLSRLRRTPVRSETYQNSDDGRDVAHDVNKPNYRLPATSPFFLGPQAEGVLRRSSQANALPPFALSAHVPM